MSEYQSTMGVNLISSSANDLSVVQSARISTGGASSFDITQADRGLINFLMKNRHGTPFEHNMFTWRIHAPIFVIREFQRHRTFSFNEESGRYTELKPVFYSPGPDRYLIQVGKAGHYTFEQGTTEQAHKVLTAVLKTSALAYNEYRQMLADGVAREVARMVLPLNIYSSMYATCNARALMNFLSLRVKSDDATYPSYPQREIEMVAEQMEIDFSNRMPYTYEAFVSNGRVSP
jgi:thymidylate synthase (FAD)